MFGYGRRHDAKVMSFIAKLKGGDYYYIQDPIDIANAFGN
jgi:hypothetical protein